MVLPALEMGGYAVERQVLVGTRLGGGRHYGDVVATKDEESILISLKWQQVSGTTEQKVPYEFMCLSAILTNNPTIDRAYIVLGGDGWTKHEFFLNDLNDWVNTNEFVDVMKLEMFVAQANQGNL